MRGRVPRGLVRAGQTAVALVLIVLLLRSTSPQELWRMRAGIHVSYWGLAIALLLAMHALGAISLLVLISARSHIPRGRLLLSYGYIQAVALFTPAQAGEALLPVLFGRWGVDPGETAAALIVQRLVTLVITVAVAALFAAHRVPEGVIPVVVIVTGLALVALVAVIRSRWLRTRFRRLGGFMESVERAGWRIAREHHTGLAVHVAIMFGRFAVAVAASWVMFRSFGMEISFLEIGGLSAAVTLAGLVPLSPGGLGVTEGIFVATLRTRYSVEQILGACLAGRLLTVLLLGALALLYSTTAWKDEPPRD
jgi:uncharacterized membrane protein YbhN (UPF0104 family)